MTRDSETAASEQRDLLLIVSLFYEQNFLWANYLNVEGANCLLGELGLGRLGETAAHEGRGDTEETLDAGAGESDQDEAVLVLLLVDRAVRRLVDEPEAKELDADDGRDE